ncbi:MAG: MFS transporter [Alphaproteobacteria bacterium]|nr:MFS transporter [Alphaproteobacteria bacterium]
MLAAFRVRSYRFQWPADLLTSWAFEMETLILGWYMLEETGSVTLLAVLGALQYMGTFIAPLFGLAGDRMGRRTVLCTMRVTYFTLAIAMMAFGLTGVLTPYHVFGLVFLMGLVRPSDIVLRNSLIGDTMPRANLTNALGFSRATGDSAKIAGALAGAGLLSTLGIGITYVFIAGFYLASFALTFGVTKVRPDDGATDSGASPWRDLLDGLAYAWKTPNVRMIMWMAFLVNLTAVPWTTGLAAYLAKEIFLLDANGLGRMIAGYACGALSGSLLLAWIGGSRRPALLMFVVAMTWYALLAVLAQVRDPETGAWVMVAIGACHSGTMILMGVALIGWAEPRFRGRVMGVRSLSVQGVPFGLLAAGPIIEMIGFSQTLEIYCAIGAVATVLLAIQNRRFL